MSETGRSRRRFTVDALFADTRPRAVGVSDLQDAKEIQLTRIVPDPDQPRRVFDEDRIAELAASIRAEGVLQPIVVSYDESHDRYVIVHGERRWRAAGIAHLDAIPALVRDVPQERRLLQQLMENIVRDDLNAVDRAAALRALRAQLGDPPWEQVAEAVGIKRSRIFQLLGTGKLPAQAQADIQQGKLSEKQSRLLQGLPEIKQEALRELLVTEQPSAQTATRLARAFRELELPPDADIEDARSALRDLRDLAVTDDPERQRSQSLALLDAIGRANGGSDRDRRRLSQLSSLVAAPRFDEQRFIRETGSLARTLAGLTSHRGPRAAEVDEQLRALYHALAALLPPDSER
ncbi:MAG: ParB/RepB/Spo0J family partition protein [Thermomicrobiales bacterium]